MGNQMERKRVYCLVCDGGTILQRWARADWLADDAPFWKTRPGCFFVGYGRLRANSRPVLQHRYQPHPIRPRHPDHGARFLVVCVHGGACTITNENNCEFNFKRSN